MADKSGHAMSVHLYIPAVCASVALFRFPDSFSFAHFGPHFDIHFKGRVQKSALFVCAENMQIREVVRHDIGPKIRYFEGDSEIRFRGRLV